MDYRPTKDALRKLTSLVQGQGGYFTAKQAAGIGYDYPHLEYHVRSGNFERSGHGLYRLPQSPLSEHDDLIRLAFWSRNRADEIQAIASHQTGLIVHGLTDLLPEKTHLTVPASFRKTVPKGVVLHRDKLDAAEIEEREGFRVTTPLRTILDIAADDSVSIDHLEKAIEQALERGLIRKSRLEAACKTQPKESRLSAALKRVA